MLRIEVIPYKSLDEQYELSRELSKRKQKKEIKNLKDLGNCFYIEHYNIKSNIRI